jgi:hypothetical protein
VPGGPPVHASRQPPPRTLGACCFCVESARLDSVSTEQFEHIRGWRAGWTGGRSRTRWRAWTSGACWTSATRSSTASSTASSAPPASGRRGPSPGRPISSPSTVINPFNCSDRFSFRHVLLSDAQLLIFHRLRLHELQGSLGTHRPTWTPAFPRGTISPASEVRARTPNLNHI